MKSRKFTALRDIALSEDDKKNKKQNKNKKNRLRWNGWGSGGRCLQENLWYSPPASMTSRLASVTFKMVSEVFIEDTDKYFDFITDILFRFLGFGDFMVPIVIEN